MDKNLIFKKIKKNFSKLNEVIGLYVYGSILTDKYNKSISDIDILMMVYDEIDVDKLFNKIIKIRSELKNLKLDINIIFQSEFNLRMHIYRPVTYFIGVKNRGKLLFGKDFLKEVLDTEITPGKIYKRAIDIAQSSRAIRINSKNEDFWEKKYIKWLKVLALEVLYLKGNFNLDFREGLEELKKIDSNFSILNILNAKTIRIEDANRVSEFLRNYILKEFILK